MDGPGRAEEAGVAVAEDAAVGRGEPVARVVTGGGRGHDRLGEAQSRGVAECLRVTVRRDGALGGDLVVALGARARDGDLGRGGRAVDGDQRRLSQSEFAGDEIHVHLAGGRRRQRRAAVGFDEVIGGGAADGETRHGGAAGVREVHAQGPEDVTDGGRREAKARWRRRATGATDPELAVLAPAAPAPPRIGQRHQDQQAGREGEGDRRPFEGRVVTHPH